MTTLLARMGSPCRRRVLPESDAGDRELLCEVASSGKRDIDLALDARTK